MKGFKKGKHVAGRATLEAFIMLVLDRETLMTLTEGALFQMVPLHLQARVPANYSQQVQPFLYALKIVGQLFPISLLLPCPCKPPGQAE
jgi:hypothetical protein